MEARCSGTEARPHPVHALEVTPGELGIGVVITAPQCSVACACCQRVGSQDHTTSSLFRPGVPGGDLPD